MWIVNLTQKNVYFWKSKVLQMAQIDRTIPLKCFCAIDLLSFLPTIAEDFSAYFPFVMTAAIVGVATLEERIFFSLGYPGSDLSSA